MCIFCKIVNKEMPASIIYEDEYTITILDINQATKGHALVLPKKHYENIYSIDDTTLNEVHKVAKKVSLVLKKTYKNIIGINILQNNEHGASQMVMHYHVHVIPRYQINDIEIKMENNMNKYDINALANEIKNSM